MEIGQSVKSKISAQILELKNGVQDEFTKLKIQKLQQTYRVLGLDEIDEIDKL